MLFRSSRRQDAYKAKGQFKQDELRRRREEAQVEIRRQKRDESMAKRRNLNIADTTLTDGDSDEEEVSGKLLEKQVGDGSPLFRIILFFDL